MKYTFLLPAWKARFFEEALGSILAQTYGDFEVIVSDDCSPEDLKGIVDKFADPRVKYRRNERNIGAEHLVDHWNLLLGLTDAQYIIMASDDDVYDPRYLEEMDRLARKYPEASVLRPLIRIINAEGRTTFEEKYTGKERLDVNEFLELWGTERLMSGVPYYVFKAEALKESGGFVDYPYATFSDDATVIKNILENGMVLSEKRSFSFRQSAENLSNSFSNEIVKGKTQAALMFNEEILSMSVLDRSAVEIARKRVKKLLLGNVRQSSNYGIVLDLLFKSSPGVIDCKLRLQLIKDAGIKVAGGG